MATMILMQGTAVKPTRSKSVPKAAQAVYDAVVALTDAFCRDHLNDEYRGLAQAMTAALCRKRPNPLASGQSRTWACGIIYMLGQLNFLSDKATEPYMTMAEVCAGFGVGQSTAFAKARVISDALHTNRMDPAWMLRSLADRNPLVDGSGQWPAGRRHAAGGPRDRVREGHDPLYPGRLGVAWTALLEPARLQ
jgi:hypothetical protein